MPEYIYDDLVPYYGDAYKHDDGRKCEWQPYEVVRGSGKTRTVVRAWGYWYSDPDDPPDSRRWCGRHDR